MNNKSYSLIYAAVALAIVVALVFLGLFWYFGSEGKNNNTKTNKITVPNTTLKIQTETNPVKKVPDLNPTEKTNPFKTKNPFE